MRWWAALGLRGKLFLAISTVLIALLLTTLASVQLTIEAQTQRTLRTELQVTGSVFERLLRERVDILIASGRLLGADFALKRAIATYDPDTLASVAVNQQQRIDLDLLWITDEKGGVLADSGGATKAARSVAAEAPIDRALATGEPAAALRELQGELFQLVCLPVVAGDVIGFLVLGERIDDSIAEGLHVDTGSHVAFALGTRLLAASPPPPSRDALQSVLPVEPGPDFLVEIDGTRYLSLAVPVDADAATPAVALLQRSYDEALAPLVELRRRILLIGLASLVIALGLALWIAQTIDKPVQTLVTGTKQIIAGNLTHRVPEKRQDELGFLAHSFNRMSAELEQRERNLTTLNAELEERVKDRTMDLEASYRKLEATQVQLVQSEKMASLGVLVAGVAHEINNPVTFVANNVEPMNERLTELREAAQAHPELGLEEPLQDLGEIVDLIREGAVRTAAIVNDLRTFSRLSDARPAFFDLNDAIEVCLRLLRPRWADRISIERDLGELPRVEGVVGQLNQVLMNLLANACDATPDRGHIWISTRREGDRVLLHVRDDGIGMSAETLERIFEPFFTTKPQGKGTGLGLAITHGIVASHGGEIKVTSQPGSGTDVSVTLPLRQAAAEEGRGAA